jgi:uncharacterized repeat protein (TIGR04076 family)
MSNQTSDSSLIIEVVRIDGNCPVHRVGDRIVIQGAKIDLERTSNLCIHALPSLLHYAVALREGVDPRKLGLSTDGKYAYLQCLDPGEPYTQGGTVIFRCYRKASLGNPPTSLRAKRGNLGDCFGANAPRNDKEVVSQE